MPEELNITLNENQKELVILKGDANKPIEIGSYSVSGNLEAPLKFYKKNKKLVEKFDSIVVVDQLKAKVTLIIGYNHPHERIIEGKLLLDPEYESLQINRNKMYSRSDLVQKLKFLRRYFPKQSDCTDLVDKFKSLEANFDLRLKQADDQRGNKTNLLEQSVDEVNFPESFGLDMPILLGGKPEKFMVNINFDIKNSSYLEFWLESVDAKDAEFQLAKDQLESSVKEFESDPQLPVIYS